MIRKEVFVENKLDLYVWEFKKPSVKLLRIANMGGYTSLFYFSYNVRKRFFSEN